MPNTYPECEKMLAVKDQCETLSAFVDWLSEEGIVLCTLVDLDEYDEPQLMPMYPNYNELFAKHFDIDLQKVDTEQRAMLEALRP